MPLVLCFIGDVQLGTLAISVVDPQGNEYNLPHYKKTIMNQLNILATRVFNAYGGYILRQAKNLRYANDRTILAKDLV